MKRQRLRAPLGKGKARPTADQRCARMDGVVWRGDFTRLYHFLLVRFEALDRSAGRGRTRDSGSPGGWTECFAQSRPVTRLDRAGYAGRIIQDGAAEKCGEVPLLATLIDGTACQQETTSFGVAGCVVVRGAPDRMLHPGVNDHFNTTERRQIELRIV